MSFVLRLFALWMSIIIPCDAYNVTMLWDTVVDPRVGGYDVYYGTGSGNYSTTISTAATSVGINDLQEGTRYFFAVKACKEDRSECSAFSNEIDYSYVRVPTNLRIISVGLVNSYRAEITLGWDISSLDGMTYAVCTVLTSATCQWSSPTATTDVKFKSLVLDPNKSYKATVRAIVNGTLSENSNTIVFKTSRVSLKNK